MFRSRPHATVLASAVMVLTTLAGCSGGGSDQGATTSTAPTTTITTAVPVAAPEGIPGVVFEPTTPFHAPGDVAYPGPKPPSGGGHNDPAVPCAFYDQPVRDEYAVHSLEHGAVWIAFDPSATNDTDRAIITNLANTQRNVLASPYAGLNAPVVLVAWERRLELGSINDGRVAQFIQTYAGGPQAPEASLGC